MITRLQPARRLSRMLRSSIGVTLALGATLVLSGAPVGATACPITSSGSCSDGSQVLTLNVLPAASLSVTAPASFALADQITGTTSPAQPLGAMGFTDTLNDSTVWDISLAATDFGAGAVPFTGMTIGVTPAADYTGQAGNAGTPVAGIANTGRSRHRAGNNVLDPHRPCCLDGGNRAGVVENAGRLHGQYDHRGDTARNRRRRVRLDAAVHDHRVTPTRRLALGSRRGSHVRLGCSES